MKIDRMHLWSQAQDLTFGEMRECAEAAEQAAENKLFQIRKRKIKALGRKPKR